MTQLNTLKDFLGCFLVSLKKKANTLVVFFAHVALIYGWVIGPNVLFIHSNTCSMNYLLIFNFGSFIYPSKNSWMRYFISSSQIKRLAIWNKGRWWLSRINDRMGIWLQWFHLSLNWFFCYRYQLIICLVRRCQWIK